MIHHSAKHAHPVERKNYVFLTVHFILQPVSISSDHQEFLKRIKKSLYYGPSNPNRMTSEPLAQHIANMFDQTQKNYSLKTLQLDQISRIRQQTPCTLILSMIYLERLNKLDPNFVKLISPSELFLVTLVSRFV